MRLEYKKDFWMVSDISDSHSYLRVEGDIMLELSQYMMIEIGEGKSAFRFYIPEIKKIKENTQNIPNFKPVLTQTLLVDESVTQKIYDCKLDQSKVDIKFRPLGSSQAAEKRFELGVGSTQTFKIGNRKDCDWYIPEC